MVNSVLHQILMSIWKHGFAICGKIEDRPSSNFHKLLGAAASVKLDNLALASSADGRKRV